MKERRKEVVLRLKNERILRNVGMLVLAVMIIFGTGYALTHPASTMEKEIYCGEEAHTHDGGCYEKKLICGQEEQQHVHNQDCYEKKLTCEKKEHAHTDGCHIDPNYEDGEAVQGREKVEEATEAAIEGTTEGTTETATKGTTEATTEAAVEGTTEATTEAATKGTTEGSTEAATKGTTEESTEAAVEGTTEVTAEATTEQKSLTDMVADWSKPLEPFSAKDSEKVAQIIRWIDTLPEPEEISKALDAYEEAGEEEAYETYYERLALRAKTIYAYYEDMGDALQQQVTNREKLLQLDSLWSVATIANNDTTIVYQINTYSQAVTTLVSGGSVKEKLGTGMGFVYWDAIVVEKKDDGTLYVSKYDTDDVSKLDYKATTEGGFVLLLYKTSVDAKAGDALTVSFDYDGNKENKAAGYGTITFGTAVKAAKDNSKDLNIVNSAYTRDLIEVNLYDYGDGINAKWESNKKYPGFQQEGGTKSIGTELANNSYNFGNNITSETVIKNITKNAGDTINGTNSTINTPIQGYILNTLKDGYPALKDGTGLAYLFSDNTYATKKNSKSIDGLFQYNEETGAYSFNSRENHAQFNAGSDTFTLYEQLISSNFMMYPFGNFLPFNDIVYNSKKSSTIDKAYLQTIAASAANKATKSGDARYGTLNTVLTKFVNLMDEKYTSGWSAKDCINGYFATADTKKETGEKTFKDSDLSNIYTIDYDEETNFFFGMEMKMNFMQPQGGLTGKDGKQKMVFYFTGDDDVWVYVDDRLFLDLSGIHRHVGGEIDFTAGEVRYYELDPKTGDVKNTAYKTEKFSALVDTYKTKLNDKGTFEDYSTHSFHFYYMERGAGSSVCRMNFNFPLLKKNSISVTKELSVDKDNVELLGNPDFKFQVLKENDSDLFITKGTVYDILDSKGNKVGTGTVDANGIFALKAGQTAVFSGIEENAGKYFVRELLDSSVSSQYGSITVDGSSVTKQDGVTVGSDTFTGVDSLMKDISSGSTAFTFNNKVDSTKLGSLSITKKLVEYSNKRTAKQFQFKVTLDGTELPKGTKYKVGTVQKTVDEVGIITLAGNETAVISGIIAGTKFKVTELEESAKGYLVSYVVDGSSSDTSFAEGIIKPGTTEDVSSVEVVITNSEKGVSLQIPVQKILQSPDGKPDGMGHSYIFQLEEVEEDGTLLDASAAAPEISVIYEKDWTEKNQKMSFTLNYLEKDIADSGATYYYKITEVEGEEANTVYDKSIYMVTVTVSKGTDGILTASITSVTRDGEQISSVTEDGTGNAASDSIIFTNRIQAYELPETGGPGIIWYIISGLLCLFITVESLIYKKSKR